MTLPILPPAPSRTDPANFSATADAWVAALPAWTNAVNAIEGSLQASTLIGTSTTSLSVGTGAKGFATQPGKAWLVGSYLFIVAGADPNKVMQGKITAYNSSTGSLVVDVSLAAGSGTYDNWSIGLTNPSTTYNDLSVNKIYATATGANTVTTRFTQGAGDANFKAGFANGNGSTVFSEQAKVGLWYSEEVTPLCHIGFNRGGDAATGAKITFNNQGSQFAEFDSSGNLGLGVTPSAWGSGGRALQFPNAAIEARPTSAALSFFQNAYYDGAQPRYMGVGPACAHALVGGQHQWLTAPSGTAGSPITFTQGMTLTAEGNLLVGTTSGSQRMVVKGEAGNAAVLIGAGNSSVGAYFSNQSGTANYNATEFLTNGGNTVVGGIVVSSTTTSYNTSSDYRLKNITGSITSSGSYIDSLNPVEGTWKADGSTFVGLIAHEVQEASRTNVATGEKDGEQMQGMDYSSAEIIANLIAEVQSLRKRLAAAGI